MKTYGIIGFATEDIFVPPEKDMDGVVKWLADILYEEGLTGTFHLIGDKVRAWKERGRNDVIKSVARHGLGSHTDRGTFHPHPVEYMADKEWEDGVEEIISREKKGFDAIKQITGKEASHLASHCVCDIAQLIYVLGKWNKSYLGSMYLPHLNPDPKLRGVFWFCGTLVYSGGIGFPNELYDNSLFNPKFEQYKTKLNTSGRKMDYICLGGGHPMGYKAGIFTDRFWAANGKNLPKERWGEWGMPALRTEQEMEISRQNFRRAAKYVRSVDWLKVTTIEELNTIYKYQRVYITKEEITEIADEICQKEEVLPGKYFSPAELTVAMAEFLIHFKKHGKIPEKIKRVDVLGPMESPIVFPEKPKLLWEEMVLLAQQIVSHVQKKGFLPAKFTVENREIGIASVYYGMAQAVLSLLHAGKITPEISLYKQWSKHGYGGIDCFPASAQKICVSVGPDYLFKEVDCHKITRYLRLHSWTVKQAWRKEEFERLNMEISK